MHIVMLACGLLALQAAGVAEAGEPARITLMVGVVEVGQGTSAAFAPALPGMAVFPGDRVRTVRGRAELRFPDGSRLRLGANALVSIMELEPAAEAGGWRIATRLSRGMIRSLVRPLEGRGMFRVVSPFAITAVKGTDYLFDGRRVIVIDEGDQAEHAVGLSGPGGSGEVLVGEGYAAAIGADGAPGIPLPVMSGEVDRLRRGFEFDDERAATRGDLPERGWRAAESRESLIHPDLLPETGLTGLAAGTPDATRPAATALGGAAGLLAGGAGLAGGVSGSAGTILPPIPGLPQLPGLPSLP